MMLIYIMVLASFSLTEVIIGSSMYYSANYGEELTNNVFWGYRIPNAALNQYLISLGEFNTDGYNGR